MYVRQRLTDSRSAMLKAMAATGPMPACYQQDNEATTRASDDLYAGWVFLVKTLTPSCTSFPHEIHEGPS